MNGDPLFDVQDRHDLTHSILIHEFVTGGGFAGQDLPESWAAEGAAMRLALAREFSHSNNQVFMTLDSRFPGESGPWTIIKVDHEPTALQHWASQVNEVVLVAPETDGVLADRTRRIQAIGVTHLGASVPAIELCADKFALESWLTNQGFATTQSSLINPDEPWPKLPPSRYPLIVKPRDGAGCLETYRILDVHEPQPVITVPSLIQSEVAGCPMSVCLLADGKGKAMVLAVGRQEIQVDDGRLSYAGGSIPVEFDAQALEPIVKAVSSIEGLKGWIGVDFLWNPNLEHATIIEVNPRLTTSFVGLRSDQRPGCLAQAWRDVVTRSDFALAERIAVQSREWPTVRFAPDGRIRWNKNQR